MGPKKQSVLDVISDAEDRYHEVAMRLKDLSKAFGMTGNEMLRRDLDYMALEVAHHIDRVKMAYDADISHQVNESVAETGRIIAALTNGAAKGQWMTQLKNQIRFIVQDNYRAHFECGEDRIEVSFNPGSKPSVPGSFTGQRAQLDVYRLVDGKQVQLLACTNHEHKFDIESWCRHMTKFPGDSRFTGWFDIGDVFSRIVRDKTGNSLEPGDFVVYATASNSSAYLKFGIVMELKPLYEFKPDRYTHRSAYNSVNILGESTYSREGKVSLQSKTSSLSDESRIVKIPPEAVPEGLRNALVLAFEAKKKKW